LCDFLADKEKETMDETNIDQLNDRELYIETQKIGVEGMSCDGCVQKIETALGKIDGVQEVRVDLTGKTATVVFDRRKTDIPTLHDTLLRSGYKPARAAEPD
jgi:copper ion binding protein